MKGSAACDEIGHLIDYASPHAVAWCAAGAEAKARDEIDDRNNRQRVWQAFCDVVGGNGITFNDTPGRTADEVAAALREAAARCEAE